MQMKPSLLFFLMLIGLLVFISAEEASAQYGNNRTITSRMESMERNIQLLQRQIATGALPEGVEPSDAAAAGLQSQLDEVREDMQKLRGELEKAQFESRQVKEQLDRMSKDMDFRLTQLEQKSAAPTNTSVTTPPPAIDAHSESQNDEIDTSTENGEGEVKNLDKPKHTESGAFESARAHYNHAFGLLNQAKYGDAGKSFSDFVKTYPKDPLAGNAFYWLGETHYVRRDYVKAADSFRQGFEAMPSGPKASDNLLKLAMSLDAMKRSKESCVVLKQLVAKFGASSETVKQKAEQEIARIGCQ
jgi:tol-pal system protein YbgF